VPVPLPPRRSSRLTLEVDATEGRVLDADDRVLSAWSRGAVDARVRELNDRFVELQLRGPGADHRLRGAATEAAVAIAERLAHDTRVAHGTDAEADVALRALAEATLPPAVRTEYHAALHAVAALLAPGERPVALAGAMRGLSDGIVLVTDRALGWWGGGRKAALVVPREEITSVELADARELRVGHGDGTTVLALVEPPGRAAELAALLAADLPEPAGIDALVAAEPDEGVVWQLRRELELARELWQDGEAGELLAIGYVGGTHGAIVLTDRRLLWASRKAEPLTFARDAIAGATAKRSLGATRLDVALRDGGAQRFDVVQPRGRAEALAAAL
jgi:hypothetical protein